MNISKTQKNKQKGFTLVETLVAISVFTVSILAVLVLVSDDIVNIGYAKKKSTASYLAQEGIEYFRNMRDTYSLYDPGGAQAGWNNFVNKLGPCKTTPGNQNKRCRFREENLFEGGNSITDVSVSACPNGNCPELQSLPGGGYGYDSLSENSGFIREIMTEEVNSTEVKIFSTVYWTQGSGTYSITFTENLYNWIE